MALAQEKQILGHTFLPKWMQKNIKLFIAHRVTESQNYRVTELQSHRVTESQSSESQSQRHTTSTPYTGG